MSSKGKVIELSRSNALLRAKQHKLARQKGYSKGVHRIVLDDLEDISLTRDGRCVGQYLSRSIDVWIQQFGPFSEIKLKTLNSNTEITYSCMFDLAGQPIEGTFGQHPDFYSGWLKGQAGARLSSCHYQFDRNGTRREARFWVMGFLHGADYMAQGDDGHINSREHPYHAGVIKAFQDAESGRIADLKAEIDQNSGPYCAQTLKDELYHKGYYEMLEAIYHLWPLGGVGR